VIATAVNDPRGFVHRTDLTAGMVSHLVSDGTSLEMVESMARRAADQLSGKCTPPTHQQLIDRTAKLLDYQDALDFLGAVKNQNDVRVLTMTGYSMRKLGKIDEGMTYYMKALSIDPNSVNTREYLGEAYLQKNDLPDAKAQLVEIQNRCGTICETFTELNEQISKYESNL
jgi:tetratricopeptide (TPR) repeat protein